jgi:N-acetylmuramoyl-L-alanine amidase
MDKVWAIILIICCSWQLGWTQTEYVKVKAKKGDGIIILLGRYGLDRSRCNLEQFCALNGLNRNSYLIAGRSYKLPIKKYVFNGKSIRSSIGVDDWHIAKQIERYNDKMCSFRLKGEDFRKGKKELWCPHHLSNCPTDLKKFIPKDRYFSIFGKKYADVPLKSEQLAGAVYYLVSGHGGPDPGASSTHQGHRICEDEYAYDITLRLARKLIEHGAIVYLITRDEQQGISDAVHIPCDENEVVWGNREIPVNQKERLKQRSDIINELYRQNRKRGIEYQRMVEIHVDSRSKSQRIDLFFYHYPQSNLGKALADLMHQTIENKYAIYRKNGQYNGDVSARDLHMLREVIPTPVFIEVGNIQNRADQKRILLPQNRQALADWFAEGLMKDY